MGVPSSSMRWAKLQVPRAAVESEEKPPIDQQREIHDRSGVALGEDDFQSVGKRGVLHRRKLQRHGRAERRAAWNDRWREGFVSGRDRA